MKMRPIGFKNPYKRGIRSGLNGADIISTLEETHYHDAFEEGADEYDRTLKERGIHAEEGEWVTVRGGVLEDDDSLPVAGTWVFIPDGDKK
jgi:hypothetical protein